VALLLAQRRVFWRAIRAGDSVPQAGARVGLSPVRARQWFAEAGGVPPVTLVEPAERSYRLSHAEREEIAVGMAAGDSVRAIAARLGRAPSTVSREVRQVTGRVLVGHYWANRAAGSRPRGRPPSGPPPYRALPAQRAAEKAARRPKTSKLVSLPRLRELVQDRLLARHSPQQIAARLRLEFPDEPELWVSHETIYQSLYVQGRGALRRELTACLRTGRAVRRPRRRRGEEGAPRRGSPIRDMVNIAERPAEAEDRAVPGHWEGDLILGAGGASAIGTLVERTTRFVLLLHLPERHGAAEVQAAMTAAMSGLPAVLRQTLTWDQGVEMANHARISDATGLAIYFCDPHSPWQRGTAENTNGLLRQYFPKGSDLSIYPADYLHYVAMQLNTRPRRTLDWRTPAEALDALLSNPDDPIGVAFTA
jgi:transposase, IS30 family